MALKGLSQSDPEAESAIVAEINITPLTDIFLVLLIIFMVTSTVMNQSGVNVNLPAASAQTAQPQPDGVVVSLLAGGGIQLNGQKIAVSDLESALKKAFQVTTTRLVVLEGDRQAFLGSAVEVMDQARRAGAERFAIATQPEKNRN